MNKIAVITGFGCVSPNGVGKIAFFDALVNGKSGIKNITAFHTEELPCRIAGEIQNFDPTLWISKKDIPHVPRTVPLALAAAHEVLADAGIDHNTLTLEEQRRFGVLMGTGGGGVEFLEQQYKFYFEGSRHKNSVYAIPSNTLGSLSSEISSRFSLKGLSHVISTGCTSSTDAMGYAAQHIESGRLTQIICGGVDAPITPAILTGFSLMKVLSRRYNDTPEQASRPFSRDRDGFVLGEGAWLYLVEEKDHDLARGAKIYAEIAGYGSSCEAHHRVRLNESAEEPARAMTMALENAGLNPKTDGGELDYINLHGTSTLLNDRVETKAIKLALGEKAHGIATSSTKSMIGHPQGASGSAGVATALCAMETGMLPPTINLTDPDPDCDLDYTPQPGRKKSVAWTLCNCIGFGSKNSALVLRKPD